MRYANAAVREQRRLRLQRRVPVPPLCSRYERTRDLIAELEIDHLFAFLRLGAFTKCLKLLYEERVGKELEVTRYGKPHNVTYKYGLADSLQCSGP